MTKKTTRDTQYSENMPVLFLAFELSASEWKLGFSIGFGQKPRRRSMPGCKLGALQAEIVAAKKRFQLPEDCRVVSCYEAGRDAFWLHRYLTKSGVENLVVDSSSIEVNRRSRRAKSDGLDVEKLLTMLMRHCQGERKVWSVVRVPSSEEEDRRQLHRELRAIKNEKTRTTNRIKGLLASQGVLRRGRMDLSGKRLDAIRLWDGSPLPPALKSRLKRKKELDKKRHHRRSEQRSQRACGPQPERAWRRAPAYSREVPQRPMMRRPLLGHVARRSTKM